MPVPPRIPPGASEYQLGLISGKLDMLLLQGAEKAVRDDARFASYDLQLSTVDSRLDVIENQRAWVIGGAATITTLVGGFATYLGLK
jgi:hypothetical protein